MGPTRAMQTEKLSADIVWAVNIRQTGLRNCPTSEAQSGREGGGQHISPQLDNDDYLFLSAATAENKTLFIVKLAY